jgi:hypothetical protein
MPIQITENMQITTEIIKSNFQTADENYGLHIPNYKRSAMDSAYTLNYNANSQEKVSRTSPISAGVTSLETRDAPNSGSGSEPTFLPISQIGPSPIVIELGLDFSDKDFFICIHSPLALPSHLQPLRVQIVYVFALASRINNSTYIINLLS